MGKCLIIKGADFSAVAVRTIEIGVEVPSISLNLSTKKVTLATTDSSLDIHYTTNGNTPTTSSTKYTAPFDYTSQQVVKAIATDGSTTSSVPKINVSYDEMSNKIALTTSQTGTIKYTTDGSTPTNSSSSYSAAISVGSISTIKAAVFNNGTIASDVTTINIS